MTIHFSIYSNFNEKTPIGQVSLEDLGVLFLRGHRNIPELRATTKVYLETNDDNMKPKIKRLKDELPCFTPGGIFGARRMNHLCEEYSGVVQIDLDVKHPRAGEFVPAIKKVISELPFVSICALSPSGVGIKALAMTNNRTVAHHTQLTHKVCDLVEEAIKDVVAPLLDELPLSAIVDRCGKAVSQAMYLTMDDDVFYNPSYSEFNFEYVEPVKKIKTVKAGEAVRTVQIAAFSGVGLDEQTDYISKFVKKKQKSRNEKGELVGFPFSTASSVILIRHCISMGVEPEVLRDWMISVNWNWKNDDDLARVFDMYRRYADEIGSGGCYEVVVKTILDETPDADCLWIPKGKFLRDVLDGTTITNSTHVVAPTGSGKTNLQFSGPCIWVFPTTALCSQFAIDWQTKKLKDAWTVWGGAPSPDGSKELIITTYDSFSRVMREVDVGEYTVILDEAHNFITASKADYKLSAMRGTVEYLPSAKKVITLTATPFPNSISVFEDYETVVAKKKDVFRRTVKLIASEESRRRDVVKSVVDRGNFSLIFLQTTERSVLTQWEKEFAAVGKTVIFINSKKKGSDEFSELVSQRNVDDGSVYISTSVIAEGCSIETVIDVVDVYIMESQHPYLIEQMARRFREIKTLNVFLLTNGGDGAGLSIEKLEVAAAERREQMGKLAVEMINGFESSGLKLDDVNIVGAPVYEDKDGAWRVDELLIENSIFQNECNLLAGDAKLTVELLHKKYGYEISEDVEVMNESAKIWDVDKIGSEFDEAAREMAIGKVFGDRFTEPSDEGFKDALHKYSRMVGNVVKELPGITKLGRVRLKDIFDDFDVWSNQRATRFSNYVKVLNSGSNVRQFYHKELIDYCVSEARTPKTLLVAGTVMLDQESLKNSEKKKMEFVMSLLMACDVKRTQIMVKSTKWVVPEDGGEMKLIEQSSPEYVYRVSPVAKRDAHVSALRSLRIFGYEPGSVEEQDEDFVKLITQVKKELPGFTY